MKYQVLFSLKKKRKLSSAAVVIDALIKELETFLHVSAQINQSE